MNKFKEYKDQINIAKDIFKSKLNEYGRSFDLLRDISLLEQIEIKLKRIINIQNGVDMKVNDIGDDIISEYLGVYNYCIQFFLKRNINNALVDYDKTSNDIYELMKKKDHDYGSAWLDMHIWTLTDLMNVKIHRIKNMILKNISNENIDHNTTEGIDSNIRDLANYAIFCLIKLKK